MDNYGKFKKEILKIKTSEFFRKHLLNPVLNLCKFRKKHHIIKIKDNFVNKALSNVTSLKDLIIAFDIEFQNVIVSKNSDYVHEDGTASFVREFGALLFIKDIEGMWYYIGDIFVNFQHLTNRGFKKENIKYLLETYSTVTPRTSEQMADNDKLFVIADLFNILLNESLFDNNREFNKTVDYLIGRLEHDKLLTNLMDDDRFENMIIYLHKIKNATDYETVKYNIKKLKSITRNIPHLIYEKYLDGKYLLAFRNQWNLYLTDPLVKRRTLDKNKEKMFMNILANIFNYCTFVTKGKRDFDALDNSGIIITREKMPNLVFENHYDIEMFNPLSRNMFGSAQLEVTYKNLIRTDTYLEHAEYIFNRIGSSVKGSAHNPVVDSLYTMIVAVVINLILFININPVMNGGNQFIHYFKKYLKYKAKYQELKNKQQII